ncbi:hypothetical protein RWE15_08095 [Virgibacillus halophilus]|uniref:Uncharacterized protein n=1 Tax=Tigheibacillus halophilus TaxID=361280 RepID=A0ABU5C776_9BACI|nr:hypothetical protein [Virgibacillus halophilus]MDY0394419.1 hypothetical protein [Virgibacillus halophilus]
MRRYQSGKYVGQDHINKRGESKRKESLILHCSEHDSSTKSSTESHYRLLL